MSLVKYRNNRMFSEMRKQIQKQYKITSSQMFFNYTCTHCIKSTFALHFYIGCHVGNRSCNAGIETNDVIAAWLFIHHLIRCPVDSIKSFFWYKPFHFNSKLIQCPSKVDSMQTEATIWYTTLRYLAVENHYRISTLRIEKMFHCEARLTSFRIGLVSEKKFIIFS